MSSERRADLCLGRSPSTGQTYKPSHDAWGAEAALASPGRLEGRHDSVGEDRIDPGRRGDGPSDHPANRRHARDARHAVDQYCAAAALTLGTASVLDLSTAQLAPQHLEQGGVKRDLVLDAIDVQHGLRSLGS